MSERYAAVLDATALQHFAGGPVQAQSVAELLAEIQGEHRHIAVPAIAVVHALAATAGHDKRTAILEWVLSEDTPNMAVVALEAAHVSVVAELMRDFNIDAPTAHTVYLSMVHDVQIATADPTPFAPIVEDPDWDLLDVGQEPFAAGGGGQLPRLLLPDEPDLPGG